MMKTLREQAWEYFEGESNDCWLASMILFGTDNPPKTLLDGFRIGMNCSPGVKRKKVQRLVDKLERVAFFYDHAGYNYRPWAETPEQGHVACAVALAEAESYYHQYDLLAIWDIDPHINSSEFEDSGNPWELWECTLWQGDDLVSSLCGIDFGRNGSPASDPYARVVIAELTLEVMSDAKSD